MASGSEPYDVGAVKARWAGVTVLTTQGRYPVEYDPIRRYCHMTHDENPLFLDPAYAKTTKYGDVICPPLLTVYFAGKGPWPPSNEAVTADGEANFKLGVPTPGDFGINLKTTWKFFKPAVIGDRLRSETKITDVFMKGIRLDPKAVWIVSETSIFDQDATLVASFTNTVLTHRSPEEVSQDQEGTS